MESVTEWIEQLKQGVEGEPQQQLLDRFLGRLTVIARKKLAGLGAYEDEDDVAIGAMKSFFVRATNNEFSQLNDRSSLWALLVTITLRKAKGVQRRHFAAKRDVRRAKSLNALDDEELADKFVESVMQDGYRLLDQLNDDELKCIALLRLEGHNNHDIAKHIGRSQRTVERKLLLIRKRLTKVLEET